MILFTDKKDAKAPVISFESNCKEKELCVTLSDNDLQSVRLALREAISKAKAAKLKNITLSLKNIDCPQDALVREVVFQTTLASYAFDKFKTEKSVGIKKVVIDGVDFNKYKKLINETQIIAEAQNEARDLANTPGSVMTPRTLATYAKKINKECKSVKVKILEEKDLKAMGANLILAVSRGSSEKPKLIVAEYKGNPSDKKYVAFVGKGVTFDTGGLDIKPAGKFADMIQDMSGGGAVLATVKAMAKLKVKRNIVAIVPAVENAVGPNSMRPGDIFTSLSGKTVEITHTDAEGRLILADAITYAKKYKLTSLCTVATLTGASLVALGQETSAVMSTNEKLAFKFKEIGVEEGDFVWPLPMWKVYSNYMKGKFADLSNNSTKTPYGGAVTAGAFLREFAQELKCDFVHIDMAPKMTAGPFDKLAPGALGGPVRLLVEIVRRGVI